MYFAGLVEVLSEVSMFEGAAQVPGVSEETAQQTGQSNGEVGTTAVASGGGADSARQVSADAFRALTARLKGAAAATPPAATADP